MKRTDVVIKIAECLIEPHFPDDVMAEASYILERLESVGMLPPLADIKDARFAKYIEIRRRVNEWESENETK